MSKASLLHYASKADDMIVRVQLSMESPNIDPKTYSLFSYWNTTKDPKKAHEYFSLELPNCDPQIFRLFRSWTTFQEFRISSRYLSSAAIVPNLEDLQSDVMQLCSLAILAQQLGIIDEFVENVIYEFKVLFGVARDHNLRTPLSQDALMLLRKEVQNLHALEAWTFLNVELAEAFTAKSIEQRVTYGDFQKLFWFEPFREDQWKNVVSRFDGVAHELDTTAEELVMVKAKYDHLMDQVLAYLDFGEEPSPEGSTSELLDQFEAANQTHS